ncbi:MAG: ferritin family protein [Candidatus Anammoxibacter sp.]
MKQIIDNCLDDLEIQIIEEEMAYQFYDKSVNSVEYISPQKQFKEMMWEEFNHVKQLRDKYKELGGNKQIIYNLEEHGGIAIPSKELNAEVALDIGLKEEKGSIEKYRTLTLKYKDHALYDFFNKLLKDEIRHLLNWERAQIEYVSTKYEKFGKAETFQSYHFTSSDLVTISEAVKSWENYYPAFVNKVKTLQSVECRDTVLSIVKNGYENMELLENVYFCLRGAKPSKDSSLPDSGVEAADNTVINNKEVIAQIIDEEKICLIRHYDWVRKCTNSQLGDVLWKIIDDKYSHLKQWAAIEKIGLL